MVDGGNATYIHRLKDYFEFLAGLRTRRPTPIKPRHYSSKNPNYHGPFQTITSNNATIGVIALYVAINGGVSSHLRYYGLRHDEIAFDNQDLVNPASSFARWVGDNNPV